MAYQPDQIFFTSDLHLGHARVIELGGRPYQTAEEMDEDLVARWNLRIRPGDTAFILGDVSFRSAAETAALLRQMNGSKVLVPGNHDSKLLKSKEFLTCFTHVKNLLEIKVQDPDAHNGRQRIVLLHFAMRVWHQNHRGAWHLYGHSHGNLEDDWGKSMDVGTDTHNFFPYSYAEIKERMAQKSILAVDHHIPKD